jgi:hypothetical protein
MQRTFAMLRAPSIVALLVTLTGPALADSTTGFCTITPKGETVEPDKRECWFSQRQGYVDIGFADEQSAFLSLEPLEGVGNYKDSGGKAAYRKKGLGDKGIVFDAEIGTVRVYWAD